MKSIGVGTGNDGRRVPRGTAASAWFKQEDDAQAEANDMLRWGLSLFVIAIFASKCH